MNLILFVLLFLAGLGLVFFGSSAQMQAGRPKTVGSLMALVGLIGIVVQSVVSIPAGHVGLKDLFGKVSDEVLNPGIHLVNPLLTVRHMDVRTQEITETATVPSKEGMNVRLDLSILYRLDRTMTADVYRGIGMDYAQVFIIPQLRAKVRGATTNFEAKALYTSQREAIASSILGELNPVFEARGVVLEKVLLRSVTLPTTVAQAIEQKLQAEQEAERMKFVLDREGREAERKRIEAKGIRDFQRIVSEGINENLLRWKGIEATEKLSNSPNAKIVVVGGEDGLPLIFNTGK
jgi:regulator of protease activity HflC (stomatin/prohibitin superfamily)